MIENRNNKKQNKKLIRLILSLTIIIIISFTIFPLGSFASKKIHDNQLIEQANKLLEEDLSRCGDKTNPKEMLTYFNYLANDSNPNIEYYEISRSTEFSQYKHYYIRELEQLVGKYQVTPVNFAPKDYFDIFLELQPYNGVYYKEYIGSGSIYTNFKSLYKVVINNRNLIYNFDSKTWTIVGNY